MLTIRNEQLTAMGTARALNFADDMVQAVASHFSRQYARLGADETRALVHRTMARGAQHRIVTRGAIAVFIELVLEFGEQFKMSPDREIALKLLAHPTLPGQVKVQAMQDRLTARTGGRALIPAE
jgi:hypothetical protein